MEKTVPLRQWIKGASRSVRSGNTGAAEVASSEYISASLKIAVALAEQISRAEKLGDLGVYRDLELLPSRAVSDWAGCVRIRLKAKASETRVAQQDAAATKSDELLDLQPLPFASGTNGSNAASGWEHEFDADMNEQLKTFLASFDADQHEASESEASRNRYGQGPSAPVLRAVDVRSNSCCAWSSEADDLYYLNVDSAEIRRPHSELHGISSCHGDAASDKLQRIYSLGLVFYELFSMGEAPPPGLMGIKASKNAFVSLPFADENESEVYTSQPKRRHSRASHRAAGEIGVSQKSFEHLKFIGLPGPLCNLIFNMIDCIDGDFSRDECYTKIADIASDLQLMLDKPSKFLQDLDLEKLSLSGLQLSESVLSRQEEFESIQSCYRRSISGSCELAIISGESGTGKSWLAQRVGTYLSEQGGIFLSGKFDQMKQAKPFAALASAFDQYCDVLIRERDADWVELVVCKLQVAVGNDACHLIKIIPKLGRILTHNRSFADSYMDQNCLNALQRLCYLLCQFVEVISACSMVSVTLFMDDVQWADEASILVLNRLLMKGHRKFFFLGCIRDNEMKEDHLFRKLIENIRLFGINTTIIELSCMDINTLNELMSNLLCLPPRQVRSLSEIVHKKTKGNLLFFSQLMVSLNRDGLLRLNLSRGRWVWDEEEIQSIRLPDNVALCFSKGISKLPLEVQSALHTLSMFGASTKCQYIEALESQLNLQLMEPLQVAAAEGLVSNVKGSFHFCHDRIQEASYAMIEKQDRCRYHLTFGLCLVKLSINTADVDMLFTAVNQVNLGGPSAVLVQEDFRIIAEYNLVAGKRAMEMSDYSSAYGFFNHGISFLPKNHWADHYQLSLELFELASQSALAIGNSLSLGHLFGEVLKYGRCFEDKLNIYFIIVSSLAYMAKVSEAFEKGRKILSRLGEDIPGNPSREVLNHEIQQTQSIIRGISEDDILNYRLMTDKNKLAAMKFLSKMQHITVMVKPTVHPFVTLKMVRLTILHGLSPVSPIGFAFFGSLLAKLGNIQLGYKFVLMAQRLLHKLDAKDFAGEVIGAGIEVQCFMEPLLAANERRTEGESAAMTAGDLQYACLNRVLYCLTLLWGGVNLSTVHEEISKACRFIKEQGHKTSLFIMLTGQSTVLTLIGNESVSALEDEQSRSVHENKNPHQLLILSFMLHNDHAVRKHAEEFFELKKNTWCMFSGSIVQTLIAGLAAFQLYRETRYPVWIERASSCTSEMKIWAEQGSTWNFKQKFLMMEAEDHFCNGNIEGAKECYKHAIAYAKLHKFINDEALASELAAKFYLQTGDLSSSIEHFVLAHKKYICWGALEKADRLFSYINEKFGILLGGHTSQLPSNSRDVHGLDEIDPRKRKTL
ncbi:hypothetical protein HJC23_009007 [Cyclotella cryptica]|uniref:Orc1-like AAA ATPase domain-containing protein n=1 Tax=Cyclotella cryptica TaxID=29204 RepID=A0ABD3QXZ3_9STRA